MLSNFQDVNKQIFKGPAPTRGFVSCFVQHGQVAIWFIESCTKGPPKICHLDERMMIFHAVFAED